jgi:hypothetical protein
MTTLNGGGEADKEDYDSTVIGSDKVVVLDSSKKKTRRTCTRSGKPKV